MLDIYLLSWACCYLVAEGVYTFWFKESFTEDLMDIQDFSDFFVNLVVAIFPHIVVGFLVYGLLMSDFKKGSEL